MREIFRILEQTREISRRVQMREMLEARSQIHTTHPWSGETHKQVEVEDVNAERSSQVASVCANSQAAQRVKVTKKIILNERNEQKRAK